MSYLEQRTDISILFQRVDSIGDVAVISPVEVCSQLIPVVSVVKF